MIKGIADYVDERHSEGKGVVANNIVAYLFDEFNVKIHRTYASKLVKKIGLSWTNINTIQNTFASHRKVVIRDFLVKLDEIVKSINNGDDHILVFTDESYVNTNHGARKSYLPKEQDEKSGLKCKHVIAPDGPLCNYEEDGITPIADFKWNGDTCHPTARTDGKLTCETLWVLHSHTGDYHDNMTSEMLMLWIKNKICCSLFVILKMIMLCLSVLV